MDKAAPPADCCRNKLSPMEIHQLRYFVAVADEGSFSRAAAREHVAQPSLSQQIQKLEADVGDRLFDRLPRSVVLTDAGQCLLPFARKILGEMADARHCVNELNRNAVGQLTIGAIPTIAPYVLPELIETFHVHYPKVRLEIFEDTTENLVRRLDDGDLDIALVSTCGASPTLELHSLATEPLSVLLSNKHGLAKKKQIKWSDLKSERFLLLHEVHCLSHQIHRLLTSHHLEPEISFEGAQLATIVRMVAAGIGLSVVPQLMLQDELPPGCISLPFTPPVPMRELNLLRNPLRFRSKAGAAFQEEAAALFRRREAHISAQPRSTLSASWRGPAKTLARRQ